MTVLENAVADLANALEKLEANLEDRLDSQMADNEAVAAAKRHAQTARNQTSAAGTDLSAAIADLKAVLETSQPGNTAQSADEKPKAKE